MIQSRAINNKKIVIAINPFADFGHERFHIVIAQFTGRVHVFQFVRIAEEIVRHLLGQPLSEDRIVF
jgi:hypothetical protein